MGSLLFKPFNSLTLHSQVYVILSGYESGQCLAEDLLIKRTKSGNRPSYGWLVTAKAVWTFSVDMYLCLQRSFSSSVPAEDT
jgi:hypothetical protein